jgi:uncharacterized membrane protein
MFLIFIVGCFSAFAFRTDEVVGVYSVCESGVSNSSLKSRALVVLQNKCNVCHLKKNKSVIFSESNMLKKARKIHKMVFVKKKMPKDDVTLTTAERKDLRLWLDSLNL